MTHRKECVDRTGGWRILGGLKGEGEDKLGVSGVHVVVLEVVRHENGSAETERSERLGGVEGEADTRKV